MKTSILILLLTGIGVLAQTPAPPAPASTTNNAAALRHALRTATATQTNVATPQPVAAPAAMTPPPAAATDPNGAPATEPAPAAQGEAAPVIPAPSTETQPPGDTPQVPSGLAIPQPGSPAMAPAAQPPAEEVFPAGQINFPAAELNQVLELYAEWVNRTILRAPNLAAPVIVLKTQTPLTKSEAIQAIDAVLGMNGIAMINVGEKFVKAVPVAQAGQEGQQRSKLGAGELPEMGQFVTHVVQLKTAKPSELVPILQAFGKTKDILPVDSSQMLIIRDYAENVKRILEMIEEIDVSTPSEFISEVIPIKYALAGDIASALSSLSGTGGGGTSVGGTTRAGAGARPTAPTARAGAALGTQQTGAPTAAGTASSSASFSDRLQSIIRRASTTGDVQVLGQTKIIADERTNSLLIFAARQDMIMIKDIVSKLDVVLAQVLIEAIIMEVTLDDTKNIGFSYNQRPVQHGDINSAAGAIRNTSFLTPGNFANVLSNAGIPSGFSYAARVHDDFDVTVQAIATDGRINVLSRPRIQTSHAVPAQLFIGNTVPYITGSTYGDFSGATSRSVYQEKRVGITLDVLPLINPDGLVVMDIQQVIQQLGTPTTIDGNQVPTTSERSASAKIAVKDRDTIILGGFISTTRGVSKSGVPFLKDIPLLGYLFRSTGDSKQRVELVVMMRPTVLPTPEIAAEVAIAEKNRSPALRQTELDEQNAEKRQARKLERKYGSEPKFAD